MVRATPRQPHLQTRLIDTLFQHAEAGMAGMLLCRNQVHPRTGGIILLNSAGTASADLSYFAPSHVMRRFQQEIFQNKTALATFQRGAAGQTHELPIGCDRFGFDAHKIIGRTAIWTIEACGVRRLACWHGSSPAEVSSTTKRSHQRCSFTSVRLSEPRLAFGAIIDHRNRQSHTAGG
jgi:hypothetical protein